MTLDSTNITDVDENLLRSMPLPMPAGHSDKESRGRVLIVGGSASVPGAPVLSGLAALRAGAGKIRLAVPASMAAMMGVSFPEAGIGSFKENERGEPSSSACHDVTPFAQQADAVLVGPGFMDEDAAHTLTVGLLHEVVGPTYILDSMALCRLADAREVLARHKGRVILTPHAGEMASLTGESKDSVNARPIPIAHQVAEHLNCTVVLKGATTYVVTPDARVWRHCNGVVGLATAGSGDVLAGIIVALAARGAAAEQSCVWSVYTHAQAGQRLSRRLGALGLLARELPAEIPLILEKLS